MSNTLQALLGCGGSMLLVVLVLLYIILSIGRKKTECPSCSKKTTPKAAYYKHPETGARVLGERDIGFALVSAIGGLLLGLAAVGFPAYLVLGSLADESCAVEGIIIRCVSYTTTMRVETTINLLIMGLVFLGGLSAVINGLARIVRSFRSRDQALELEFECPSCKKTWSEPADQGQALDQSSIPD